MRRQLRADRCASSATQCSCTRCPTHPEACRSTPPTLGRGEDGRDVGPLNFGLWRILGRLIDGGRPKGDGQNSPRPSSPPGRHSLSFAAARPDAPPLAPVSLQRLRVCWAPRPYHFLCAPRSHSHFSFAAVRFAGSLLLWRRHLAAGGDTLRTILAGGHLMFADTLLFKTMMDILFVDVPLPGAAVSPGNRCPL